MKNFFLLPVRFCTHCLHRFFDLLISAMRLSALNWLKIGRHAADAGLDVADSAREHGAALQQRISSQKKK